MHHLELAAGRVHAQCRSGLKDEAAVATAPPHHAMQGEPCEAGGTNRGHALFSGGPERMPTLPATASAAPATSSRCARLRLTLLPHAGREQAIAACLARG